MDKDPTSLYQPLIAPRFTVDAGAFKPKPVIVIAGPTAVGKTALSLELAREMGGEIVSADSIQVYKELEIGAAKPSREELCSIPHHLIDVCDLSESYNVARFYHEATKAIKEIQARGNIAIVVGGTGFYVSSLLYGPPTGPPASMEVRGELEKELERLGVEALYERLKQVDPEYGEKITANDKQKVIRGLEIMVLTGKKVSDFESSREKRELKNYNFRCFFLYYPRDVLYPKIEVRCDEMLAHGLIDETAGLIEKGLLENTSAASSIGYRQCIDYLHSAKTVEDFEHFVSEFKKMTRRYAKRQFTWFRREALFRWLDMGVHGMESIKHLIMMDYDNQI